MFRSKYLLKEEQAKKEPANRSAAFTFLNKTIKKAIAGLFSITILIFQFNSYFGLILYIKEYPGENEGKMKISFLYLKILIDFSAKLC